MFEITVVVFAKLMWCSENEKGTPLFPVSLLLPIVGFDGLLH